jgi:hypothetical protein
VGPDPVANPDPESDACCFVLGGCGPKAVGPRLLMVTVRTGLLPTAGVTGALSAALVAKHHVGCCCYAEELHSC